MTLITVAVSAIDNIDSDPSVVLASITMNEGDETYPYRPLIGIGHTFDDIVVDNSGNIFLRAERSGKGDGRVYTLTYAATDAAGNTATATATVTVAHNQ